MADITKPVKGLYYAGVLAGLGIAITEGPKALTKLVESIIPIQDNSWVIDNFGKVGNAIVSYSPEIVCGGLVFGAAGWLYNNRKKDIKSIERIELHFNRRAQNP